MSGTVFLGPLSQVLGLAQAMAGGGLPMLLAQLENAGLAERVRSWVGSGENLPVTPEELAAVFTPEQLIEVAATAGTTPAALLMHLSERLPGEVDRATLPG